jgi:hypothetical protein
MYNLRVLIYTGALSMCCVYGFNRAVHFSLFQMGLGSGIESRFGEWSGLRWGLKLRSGVGSRSGTWPGLGFRWGLGLILGA